MERLKLNNTNKGIILITLSAFCFALMGMFVRLAGDLPAMQKSFFRNIVALVFSVAVLLKEHKKITVPKSAVKYLFLRAFFGTVGIVCNFYAIGKLVLADASILNKMSPFFAILGSLLILKEKISPKKAIIVLAAFIGCLFVIKPTFRNAELVPSLIGLLGGFGAGMAYTMVHKLGQEKVDGSFIVFFLLGIFHLGISAVYDSRIQTDDNLTAWLSAPCRSFRNRRSIYHNGGLYLCSGARYFGL